MLSFRPLLAAAVLALWMPATAQAAVISQTENFGSVSLADTDPIATLTFNQFDASLGTLNRVTITLEATLTGDTTLRHGSGGAVTPAGDTIRTLTLDLSAAGLVPNLIIEDSDTWDSGQLNNGAFKTKTQSATHQDIATIEEETLLAFFIGIGTFDLDLLGSISHTFNLNNYSIDAMTGFAAGSVTVAYDYTEAGPSAVPEPAVLGLVGLGLLGLGLVAHRRRRVA